MIWLGPALTCTMAELGDDASGYSLGDATSDFSSFLEVTGSKMVIVQIQYRLGVFGFLPGQAIKDNGVTNAGMLDQVSCACPIAVERASAHHIARRISNATYSLMHTHTLSLQKSHSNLPCNGLKGTFQSSVGIPTTSPSGENRQAPAQS